MKTLYIHPKNPQPRLLDETTNALLSGKVVIIPTECGYRFAFAMNAKDAFERLVRVGVNESDLVLLCKNISQLSGVAVITNDAFITLKNDFLPHHVFILEPTKAVNKKIIRKKSLRFTTSAMPIMTALLEQMDEPFFTAPLICQGESVNEYDITDKLDSQAEIFVDVGVIDEVRMTVIDLMGS